MKQLMVTVRKRCSKLFDCERASLFVVDDEARLVRIEFTSAAAAAAAAAMPVRWQLTLWVRPALLV
jgi:hypothetical protein